MHKLKNLIKENPDGVGYYVKNKHLGWSQPDAHPFGFHKNKAYIGESGDTHGQISDETGGYFSRDSLKYPGRLWYKDKVITFWEFPPRNKMKFLISQLEKAAKKQQNLNLKIWNNDWKIEVIDKGGDIYDPKDKTWGWDDSSELSIIFIPLEKYQGSHKQVGKELSHKKSPLLKKKKEVPKGLGSRKKVKGAKKGETPAATRFRLKRGLGDGIIKLKDLIKEFIYEYKYDIYLDLDGVLTDFVKQFEIFTGIKDGKEFERKRGTEAFWGEIGKGGLDYWSEMPWMEDGEKLWNYLKDKNVKILSAPAKTIPECSPGKRMWVKKNLGSVELVICSAKEKQDYAKKNAILIDDKKENIDQWNARGGIGILHKSAASTIKKIKGN